VIDDGDMCVALFLDLRRAFETVDRVILLKKLKNWYGVDGDLYEWIEDYLEDRSQKVRFGVCVSTAKEVKYGVPQGSKLGPLLFLIYVNDLPHVLKKCRIHMFADDTLIYCMGKNGDAIVENLNFEMLEVKKWLDGNKLSLNAEKTKCMVIGTRGQREEMKERKVYVDINTTVQWVDDFQYLGVIVDERLRFTRHVDYVVKKMAKKIGIIRKLKGVLSTKAKEILFKCIVVPHIRYCSTVLFGCNVGDMERLQKVLNIGMRIVLNRDRRSSTEEMRKELEMLEVNKQVVKDVLVWIFKMEKDLLPSYLQKFTRKGSDVHVYNTRRAGDFYRGIRNKKLSMRSMFFEGVRIFNRLPAEVKGLESVSQFKEGVEGWLRNTNMKGLRNLYVGI